MNEYTLISSLHNQGTYYFIKPELVGIGLTGYFMQVVRAIFKFPDQKYYIYIGPPTGGENVWDFYFKQPNPEINPNKDQKIADVGIIFDEESEFVEIYPCMKKLTSDQIKDRWRKFNGITKKYFVLHEPLQAKINEFKANHFAGKKVMGLHYRGADAFTRVSGDAPPHVTTLFERIDKELEGFDAVFVCTDDTETFGLLTSRYGSKVIHYEITTRSNVDHGNYPMSRDALSSWTRNNEGYKIGEDLVMETHLLASTDLLLCGCFGNVNAFVRALNPELPAKIMFVPTIL
jgi:hypothetical protein